MGTIHGSAAAETGIAVMRTYPRVHAHAIDYLLGVLVLRLGAHVLFVEKTGADRQE